LSVEASAIVHELAAFEDEIKATEGEYEEEARRKAGIQKLGDATRALWGELVHGEGHRDDQFKNIADTQHELEQIRARLQSGQLDAGGAHKELQALQDRFDKAGGQIDKSQAHNADMGRMVHDTSRAVVTGAGGFIGGALGSGSGAVAGFFAGFGVGAVPASVAGGVAGGVAGANLAANAFDAASEGVQQLDKKLGNGTGDVAANGQPANAFAPELDTKRSAAGLLANKAAGEDISGQDVRHAAVDTLITSASGGWAGKTVQGTRAAVAATHAAAQQAARQSGFSAAQSASVEATHAAVAGAVAKTGATHAVGQSATLLGINNADAATDGSLNAQQRRDKIVANTKEAAANLPGTVLFGAAGNAAAGIKPGNAFVDAATQWGLTSTAAAGQALMANGLAGRGWQLDDTQLVQSALFGVSGAVRNATLRTPAQTAPPRNVTPTTEALPALPQQLATSTRLHNSDAGNAIVPSALGAQTSSSSDPYELLDQAGVATTFTPAERQFLQTSTSNKAMLSPDGGVRGSEGGDSAPPLVSAYNPMTALREAGHDKIYIGHLNRADKEVRQSVDELERLAFNELSLNREKKLVDVLGSNLGGLRRLRDAFDPDASAEDAARFDKNLEGLRKSVWKAVAEGRPTSDAQLAEMILHRTEADAGESRTSFFDPAHRLGQVSKQELSDAVIELRQLIATVKDRHIKSGALLSPSFLSQVDGPLFVVSHAEHKLLDKPNAEVVLYGPEASAGAELGLGIAKLAFSNRYLPYGTDVLLPLDASSRRSARDEFVEDELSMPLESADPADVNKMRALFNDENLKSNPTGWSYSLLDLIAQAADKTEGFAPTQISLAMCNLGEPLVFEDLVQDIRQTMPTVARVEAVQGPLSITRGKGFTSATNQRDVAVVESLDGGAAQELVILKGPKNKGTASLGSADDSGDVLGLSRRDDVAAMRAFTNPRHWHVNEDGLFVPDPAKLTGQPALMWSRLREKFGDDLAAELFDAGVRSGFPGVLQVANQTAGRQTITLADLLELAYLAIASETGAKSNGLLEPALHDVTHLVSAYGVNEFEEDQGAYFSDAVFAALNGLVKTGELNPLTPLSRQATAARTIDAMIRASHSDMLRDTSDPSAYVGTFRSGINGADLDGNDNAVQVVKAIEDKLDATGLLTEPNERQRLTLRQTMYGSGVPKTLEEIVDDYRQTSDKENFKRETEVWMRPAGALLQSAWQSRQMTLDEFYERAERIVAFRIMLERVEPDWVADRQTFNIELNRADSIPHGLRELDLRVVFAELLTDVHAALAPFKAHRPR
jgi:hypothetical protein